MKQFCCDFLFTINRFCSLSIHIVLSVVFHSIHSIFHFFTTSTHVSAMMYSDLNFFHYYWWMSSWSCSIDHQMSTFSPTSVVLKSKLNWQVPDFLSRVRGLLQGSQSLPPIKTGYHCTANQWLKVHVFFVLIIS